MPFLINTVTREITEIFIAPREHRWISKIFDIKVLAAWHYELEYSFRSIRALHNETNLVIVQTKDEAWDFEYATRESSMVKFIWGPPCPVEFPKFNLERQNALSLHQWETLKEAC